MEKAAPDMSIAMKTKLTPTTSFRFQISQYWGLFWGGLIRGRGGEGVIKESGEKKAVKRKR